MTTKLGQKSKYLKNKTTFPGEIKSICQNLVARNYLKPDSGPLKSDSHLPKKIVICFIKSLLKKMKNAFYIILKALFVLKIFKFLS